MFDRTSKKFIRRFNQGGQALIELALTLIAFVSLLFAVEKMVQTYKLAQKDKNRITYDSVK